MINDYADYFNPYRLITTSLYIKLDIKQTVRKQQKVNLDMFSSKPVQNASVFLFLL